MSTHVIKTVCNEIKTSSAMKMKDSYTYNILTMRLNDYIQNTIKLQYYNNMLSKKKIRNDNFPSDISENIIKFIMYKKYGVMPTWDTEKGDLSVKMKNQCLQIEVKAFMSNGPTSFGPKEPWDWIYFVDARDVLSKRFKVYEIKLSNTSKKWRDIKISGQEFNDENVPELPENLEDKSVKFLKNLCEKRGIIKTGNKNKLIENLKTKTPGSKLKTPKTYGQICDENKRGELRSSFYKTFKPGLGDEHCKLIFDGNISQLELNYSV